MWIDAVELILCCCLLIATAQTVKYRDATSALRQQTWAIDDVAIAVLIGALAFGTRFLHVHFFSVTAILIFIVFLGMWIDAVLYRVFTIEFGFEGIGGVVFSLLLVELSAFSRARRFFTENLAFTLFPFVVLVIFGRMYGPLDSPVRIATGLVLVVYFALTNAQYRRREDAPRPSSLALRWFFAPRPFPDSPRFSVRPEHAELFADVPLDPPALSRVFGSLAGASVVVLSFESASAAHADTPWVRSLLPHAVRSRRHFCVSPTTNNAHACLFPPRSVSAFSDAGYRTIYLTTVETKHFGLRPILRSAGFEHVIDGEVLEPHDLDGGRISDYAIMSAGVRALADLPRDKPIFLHVHASNTHLPYRVVNPSRFNAHGGGDDRSRFLNGIEETDWIFSTFMENLIASGVVCDPLLVVTSDHGQSFGELGYHSHGSAVTKEQLNVPFLMQHPRLVLPQAAEIAWSSHHDVVPTIADLLGIEVSSASGPSGASVFAEDRSLSDGLVVWAGHPSRSTTTCYGLILADEQKFMLDLIRDRCYRTDWDDRDPVELSGAEKNYYSVLLSRMMKRRGIS